MYFVKGDNPLCIYKFNGFYLYASTEEILQKALKKMNLDAPYEKVSMNCGEILKIDCRGFQEWEEFTFSHFMLGHFPPTRYTGYLSDTTLLDEIMAYAQSIGVSPDDITTLLEFGYDESEIEEMLYDPIGFQACLQEVYETELDYYYESLCM